MVLSHNDGLFCLLVSFLFMERLKELAILLETIYESIPKRGHDPNNNPDGV